MSDAGTGARKAELRRTGFLWFGVAVVLAALVYGAWWWLTARYSETTDDAYVAGNIVAVTSRENATVTALYADNTQAVRRGQLLIEMDPSVADVALRAAEANLARVVPEAEVVEPKIGLGGAAHRLDHHVVEHAAAVEKAGGDEEGRRQLEALQDRQSIPRAVA